MSEKDSIPRSSHQGFPSVDEAAWRAAVAEAGQSVDKTIDGVRFSAINTLSDLPPSAPSDKIKDWRPFGTLEVVLPTPLPPKMRTTTLATEASGWKTDPCNLPTLLDWQSSNNVPLTRLSVEFSEPNPDLSAYLLFLRKQANAEVSAAVYSPITQLSHWQTHLPDLTSLVNLSQETSDLVNLTTIAVRGDAFARWGARATDELALTLSWWVAYCDQLTDLGLSIEVILARSELSLSTDADYFVGLAKFRAVRSLIDKVVQAYGVTDPAQTKPPVRAVSAVRNKTYYDPDTNLLRNTTEALASLLGGVDTLSLIPHDFLGSSPDPFGIRMLSNTYQILRHEAQLDKVADPAAGSYFLENLTGQLVEKSWQQFLDWEDQGGFVDLLRNNTLEAHCRANASRQASAFQTHRRILVGATRYGNAREQNPEPLDASIDRNALPFERIRNAIDRSVAQGKSRPVVVVCVQPVAPVANQRKNYVQDVLVCLGIAVRVVAADEPPVLTEHAPPIALVFCGTDGFYQTTVVDALLADAEVAYPRWIAGGSSETIQQVRQAGGSGVLGIGHDLIALVEPLINNWMHEA